MFDSAQYIPSKMSSDTVRCVTFLRGRASRDLNAVIHILEAPGIELRHFVAFRKSGNTTKSSAMCNKFRYLCCTAKSRSEWSDLADYGLIESHPAAAKLQFVLGECQQHDNRH